MKVTFKKWSRFVFSLTITLSISGPQLLSQPSGGPYGPIPQKFDLPEVTGTVWFASPNASSQAAGTDINNPTSIETAFLKAKSGDAIILRGGVYRTGNLILNQGITIQAYGEEQPVLKGTQEVTEWIHLGNELWMIEWEHLFPMKPENWWFYPNAGRQTPLHRFNNDMVFADGRFLQSAGWLGEVDENNYFIDYSKGHIFIGVNPEEYLIEITAHDIAIHRVDKDLNGVPSDRKGPTIRGITFTQYAHRALEIDGTDPEGLSPENEHGKRVTGTTLEHLTISFCSRVAGYFRGDNFTMKNCLITDTSTEGVFILSSNDVLLERNIFTRNNIENITGYFPAAVKIFNQCYRVVCNDNLITDLENSHGIWYDVGHIDAVFTNNRLQNIGKSSGNYERDRPWVYDSGFFFEISKGVTVAGNEFINCDQGIFFLNVSDTRIYQNTFINSSVAIARTPRNAEGDRFDWHPTTGPDVDERTNHIINNNLFVATKSFHKPFINVWQSHNLCNRLLENPVSQMDGNVFINNPDYQGVKFYWSPLTAEYNCHKSFRNLMALQRELPQFNKKSRSWNYGSIPLFKSEWIGSYELLPTFPGNSSATPLPNDVKNMLHQPKGKHPFVGARP